MYFFYIWCTREGCKWLGRNPFCRDSIVNHMFRNSFPMRDNSILPLSLGTRGKLYDLSFGMYFLYTWCTRECCNRPRPFLQYKEVIIRSTKNNLRYLYCFLYGNFQGFVFCLASSRQPPSASVASMNTLWALRLDRAFIQYAVHAL